MNEKTKFGTQLMGVWFLIGSLVVSIIVFTMLVIMGKGSLWGYYIGTSVLLIILIIAIKGLISLKKDIKSYRNFLKNGKLIKDLPLIKHYIINRDKPDTSKSTFIAVVDYTTKEGKTISIGSEYPLDSAKYGNRETVDLYIDENNLKNYIVDFDLESKIKNNEFI